MPALFQSDEVLAFRERSFLLSLDHRFLAEVWKLLILMSFVEPDHIFQRVHRRARPERSQIIIQVIFEFVKENRPLRIVKSAERRVVGWIDDYRAQAFHFLQRPFQNFFGNSASPEKFARHPDARAAQAIWIQKSRVLALSPVAARFGDPITWIDTRKRAEQNSRVRNRPRHRTGSILAVPDWNDARGTHQPNRRLDSHNSTER